jgi:aspartate-semialdehyde dehydrogenase
LDNKKIKNNIFVHPIEFNLIPHIDSFEKNWYTREEMKVAWETKKIFWDSKINISCTAVRIPTLRAHSESIVLETKKDINPEDVKKILNNSPWVELVDDIDNNLYPMPLTASNKYNIEVWRIRQSLVFGKKWIEFFVSWDQLLKWAALNAVQIMEVIIKNKKK